jgi:uncharacterized membrane protein (DUF106 family)
MKAALLFLIADVVVGAALALFQPFYEASLRAGDVVFGWLLALPSDATLIMVAVLTSLTFVVVRKFTVDQDLARRCRLDKQRLNQLTRQAKAERNKDALGRYQATVAQIGMKVMKLEILPTLVALLPVGFLAIWAYERLNYFPPQAHQPVEVAFYLPVSACGRLIHISPIPGVSADGWLKPVTADNDKQGQTTNGIARWKLHAENPGEYTLRFHFDDKVYEHPVAIGARNYAPTLKQQDGKDARIVSEVKLRQRKLFGVLPGTEALGWPGILDPWLVGYLALVIPLFFVNKWLFRVE